MVMVLIAGAVLFGKFLAVSRIPFTLGSWIAGLDMPGYLIIGTMVLVYFAGGLFMDSLALVMLTIPIFFPIVLDLGYDPIWFGIIIVMIIEMGLITPPVGLNVYVVYGVARTLPGAMSLESIFKGVLPFMLAILVGIFLMFLFPQIILFLPNLMY